MELHFFLEQLDGQRRELVHPVSFSLVRSADTPADSLKAEFMVPDAQEWEQEIARIELQAEGKRLFRGICDRQIVEVSGAGCRLTVWARSDAAVLLELQPASRPSAAAPLPAAAMLRRKLRREILLFIWLPLFFFCTGLV